MPSAPARGGRFGRRAWPRRPVRSRHRRGCPCLSRSVSRCGCRLSARCKQNSCSSGRSRRDTAQRRRSRCRARCSRHPSSPLRRRSRTTCSRCRCPRRNRHRKPAHRCRVCQGFRSSCRLPGRGRRRRCTCRHPPYRRSHSWRRWSGHKPRYRRYARWVRGHPTALRARQSRPRSRTDRQSGRHQCRGSSRSGPAP